MGHSWQGEFIFPQAMQGSLSHAPSAVSSSSLLSCQAGIRKLHGGIASFCALLPAPSSHQPMEARFGNPQRQGGR